MYLTEMEIFSQQESLEKTLALIVRDCDKLKQFFSPLCSRYVFFGCGSSYLLAKSGAKLFAMKAGVDAYALAGGEFLLNPVAYRSLVKGAVVVFLSRSGATSEMVLAAKALSEMEVAATVVLTMKEDSELARFSDYTLEMPWAFDQSVCQTRTVTNFYAALLFLSAIYDGDDAQIRDVSKAISQTSELLQQIRPAIKELVLAKPITDVVVLADGALCGIAAEAALAFTEVCLVSGKYFNLLDYRHGPKVLHSAETLTILAMQPLDEEKMKLQHDLLRDINAHRGTTVVVCPAGHNFEADATIDVAFEFFPTCGIALICAAQVIAYEKAIVNGVNPDEPTGLTSWISL